MVASKRRDDRLCRMASLATLPYNQHNGRHERSSARVAQLPPIDLVFNQFKATWRKATSKVGVAPPLSAQSSLLAATTPAQQEGGKFGSELANRLKLLEFIP